MAARLLQAMGESMEPVLFAVALDYFPQPEERLAMIAALCPGSLCFRNVLDVLNVFVETLWEIQTI